MKYLKVEVEIKNQKEIKNVENEKNSASKVLNWIKNNLKFIFIPGYRIDSLTNRELIYEKRIGKRRFIRRLRSVLTIIGFILIFIVLSFVVLGSWISPYSYQEAMGSFYGNWNPPSPEHPLGQSYRGRDVLSRLIFGANSSLYIASLSVTISVIFGIIIGLVSAYYGKWLDMIIMRIIDIILAFPGIVLAIVIISITRSRTSVPLMQSILNTSLIFGIINIPYFARLIRGSVIQVREFPYINAAKVVGANNSRIMFKHILPNCIQPVIISMSFKMGSIIISLSVLSFLGFGDPRMIDWGSDILAATNKLIQAPWASLWPSIMILITALGFMLIGDGLRDAFDPYMRK